MDFHKCSIEAYQTKYVSEIQITQQVLFSVYSAVIECQKIYSPQTLIRYSLEPDMIRAVLLPLSPHPHSNLPSAWLLLLITCVDKNTLTYVSYICTWIFRITVFQTSLCSFRDFKDFKTPIPLDDASTSL